MATELTLQHFINYFEGFWQAHKHMVFKAYFLGLESSRQEEFAERLAQIDPAASNTLTDIVVKSIFHALNMICLEVYENNYPDLDRDRIVKWMTNEGWVRVHQVVGDYCRKVIVIRNRGVRNVG